MLIINSIIFVKKIRLSLVCCASHHCYFVSLQHFPPPLPSKTPPPPPPKTTRKQASIDSGIVQWTKRLRVGPNNTLTTQQKSTLSSVCFYPHIPRSPSQLDKMNTSPPPHPFCHLPSVFGPPAWRQMQSAAGSVLHRWVVTEHVATTTLDMRLCSVRWAPTSSFIPTTCVSFKAHFLFTSYSYSHFVQRFVYTILFFLFSMNDLIMIPFFY